MSKRKQKSKLVGQMRLRSSRKPYYFQVYLWSDIAALHHHFDLDPTDDTLAMTTFEPWFVDHATGKVFINPKLGELHFAVDHWNVNVVAHEVTHAIMHRMRLIWPPAHLLMLDEYADAEEEVAYELGNWTERVHHWLWQLDPGGAKNPAPYHRQHFPLPAYTSDIRHPKSTLTPKPKKEVPNVT